MRQHELVFALNAGGVDKEAVARVDLQRMRLAGEHPVSNLLPRVLGPVGLRPGSENLAPIPGNSQTRQLPFIRTAGDSYILLLSPGEMRVSRSGAIQQVPAVSTLVDRAAWVDVSTPSADVRMFGEPLGLLLSLTESRSFMMGTTTAAARQRQQVAVALADQQVAHVLRVVVERGAIVLRVGTTEGGDELIEDATLDTGTHKIAFTPGAASIWIEFRSDDPSERIISEIQFESTLIGGTGDLVIPTPWTAFADIEALRTWQSLDVLFAGDGTHQQRRIEHRGPLSWGIALYKTDDGPFVAGSTRVTMTPSGLVGNVTVTASENVFKAGHVGALIEVTQTGKLVEQTFNAVDQVSDHITVYGITTGRYFYRTGVDSAFVGTLVLERSFDAVEPATWTTFATFTDAAVGFARTVVNDALDNLTVHYRFRVDSYTSGACDMTLEFDSDTQDGRARIISVTNATLAEVEVIRAFGNTTATRNWRIGDWSDARGWPRTPVIHDSRLHWFRTDTNFASKPDDYVVFDDATIGDSAPLTRSVGSGGEDGVVWAASLERLIVGTASFEASIQSSELDGVLTQTEYTVRKPSRRGCANVDYAAHTDGLFFVQRSGRKLYEMSIKNGETRLSSQDISRLNPEAYRPGIKRLIVQQQPDTRLYAVLDDGTLAVLTYERDDEVIAITTASIAGATVEDACVLPNEDQDDVYLIVNRNGTRYHERLGQEHAQTSASTCTLLDSHKVLTGPVTQITNGQHLAGQTVQIWADGKRRADVTIGADGTAEIGAGYFRVVYGLAYTADFKSVKLAHAPKLGSAVGQDKMVRGVGIILANSCLDGITVGRDADHLENLPLMIDGVERTENQMFAHHDQNIFAIQGEWTSDARFHVRVNSAEGPVTMQAIVMDIETRDGAD